MGKKVVIEINQQQERMLDWLVEAGTHGSTHGDVVRSGFLEFCDRHPELVGSARKRKEDADGRA